MKKSVLLLVSLLFTFIAYSQKAKDTNKEYFLDAEYFFSKESYPDALYEYLQLYHNGFEKNTFINYRIGVCYLHVPGQKERSIPYLQAAVTKTRKNNRPAKFKQDGAPMDAWLYLGIAYRVNNRLEEAIEAYQKYQPLLPKKDQIGHNFIISEIEACRVAGEFMNNPTETRRFNLGEPINTASSNFRAVLSGNGKTLVYMTELPFYNAVFYARFVDGGWSEPENITAQLQSDGDQYVSSISFDGNQLYLTRESDFRSDIYLSIKRDSLWGKSIPLPGEVNSRFWESHASISADGKTLYFASNRFGGYGGMDIYKATLGANRNWTNVANLGPAINTPVNEDTPFITEDGKTLYFSSQGHKGMGGYDFYKASLNDNNEWGAPENLGYPLSTTDDDLFYYPWLNGNYGLLALFAAEGLGKADIYEVQLLGQDTQHKSIVELLQEKEEARRAEVAVLTGQKEEKAEAPEQTEEGKPALVDKPVDEPVAPMAEVPVAEEKPVSTPVISHMVILNPVYFAFDSDRISAEGQSTLDSIAGLLKKFPSLRVKFIGFTDSKGPAAYNQLLSERRAQSALDYLITKEIDPSRLSATGFGETRFVAINTNPDGTDNPEGRKLNRRIEFEFTGKSMENIQLRSTEIPEHLRFK